MNIQAIQIIENIIEGCQGVKENENIHKDAKDLSNLVIKDCRKALIELGVSNHES
jgi:hypothetical protein